MCHCLPSAVLLGQFPPESSRAVQSGQAVDDPTAGGQVLAPVMGATAAAGPAARGGGQGERLTLTHAHGPCETGTVLDGV